MDKKTVFVKTDKGESETAGRSDALYGDAKRILNLVDDESTVAELTKRAPPSLRDALQGVLQELVDGGYIRDMRAPVDVPKASPLKMATPAFKMATPKFAAPLAKPAAPSPAPVAATPNRAATPAQPASKPSVSPSFAMPDMAMPSMPTMPAAASKKDDPASFNKRADLDFSFILSGSDKVESVAENAAQAQAQAIAKKDAEVARLKAEQAEKIEAAAKAAKQKAYDEAKQRAQIEVAARARIDAEAKLKREAESARVKAELEAQRARAESEAAKARIEAEVRARIEAEARVKKEAEAARIRAEKEAEKLRLELEAAKAQAEREAKIRLEAEMRAKAEAEQRAKREAEAERLRLEKQRAELEIARVRAETELKLREEAELRFRLEVEARLRSEAAAKEAELRGLQLAAEKAQAALTSAAPGAAEQELDPAVKLRQSFASSLSQDKPKQESKSTEFKLENFSLMDTGKMAALGGQAVPLVQPEPLPGAGSKVKAAIALRAQKEAEAQQLKATQESERLKAEQDNAALLKFEQEQAARIKVEQELIRLKAEQEARDKADAEARQLSEDQAKQWEDAQRKAAIQAQAEIERAAREAADAKAKLKIKPSRGPRKPLPFAKILGGAFLLCVVSVFALPYIWPLDDYIAPLEQEISAQLHLPVHIKNMTVTLLPPKLELHSVAIGNSDEMKVAKVEMDFDFSAYFAPVKSIGKLELNEVEFAGAYFEKTLTWLQTFGSSERYPVTRMELKNVRVNTDKIQLPLLSGRVDFDLQGKFAHADLKTEDEKISLEIQPQQSQIQVELNMHETSLPILQGIKFNDLSATAVTDKGQLSISDFFAHIHGGTLTGKVGLNWQNGWKLQGQLNAKSMDLQRMFPNFGLSGELAGDVVVAMSSPVLAQLGKDAHIDGTFEAKNGVIKKIDIETVARFGARPGVAGHSNFSEMAGTIKADDTAQRIFIGRMALPSSVATGLLDIDDRQQLSGKLSVDIKGQGNIPLLLTGSTSEPNLQSVR